MPGKDAMLSTALSPLCGIMMPQLRKAPRAIYSITRAVTTHEASSMYLERLYDKDTRTFLELLRNTVLERDSDVKQLLCNFQRHLRLLRSSEILELMEMLNARQIRENDDGVDLLHLLVCEINRRMMNHKNRHFSLQQIQGISSVLRHVKFHRPSNLIAPQQHAVDPAPGVNDLINTGFRLHTWDNVTYATDIVDGILDTRHDVKTPQALGTPNDPEGNQKTVSRDAGISDGTDIDIFSGCQSPGSHNSTGGIHSGSCCDSAESDPPGFGSEPLFRENLKSVVVPVCEVNIGTVKSYKSCVKCVSSYGHLLGLSGYDQLGLFMVLAGSSIIEQSRYIQKKHENAVTGYMSLSSHLNCTMNSHLLGAIMAQYRASFMTSKSLRNIAIALHTVTKCKVTCNWVVSGLFRRISQVGDFELLCASEKSLRTLLIAFNQIVSAIINCNLVPISESRKQVGINIVTYLVGNYERLFCNADIDQEVVKSAKGNVKLLVDYLEFKGLCLDRILVPSELESLSKIVADAEVEYPIEFRTSDLHKQVASILETLGMNPKHEVYINPHFCDLLIERLALEIDGPYHFTTGINERINRVLNRELGEYRLTYSRNSKIKHFMLGVKGFNVVHIPYFSWPSNKQEQLAYLQNLVA